MFSITSWYTSGSPWRRGVTLRRRNAGNRLFIFKNQINEGPKISPGENKRSETASNGPKGAGAYFLASERSSGERHPVIRAASRKAFNGLTEHLEQFTREREVTPRVTVHLSEPGRDGRSLPLSESPRRRRAGGRHFSNDGGGSKTRWGRGAGGFIV